jgi:hypothetical protein
MAELLPLEFRYVVKCTNIQVVEKAISYGIKFEMLSFANIDVWNDVEAVKMFVNAGGNLTVADLSFALANEKCDLNTIFSLTGVDIFDRYEDMCKDEDEEYDEYGNSKGLTQILSDLCSDYYNNILFVNTKDKIIMALLQGRRPNLLSDIDTIVNIFGDNFVKYSHGILDACLQNHNGHIVDKLVDKLIEKQLISIEDVVQHIFFAHKKMNGLNQPIKEDMFLHIIKNYDPNLFSLDLARKSLWTSSILICEYFSSCGFDIFSGDLQMANVFISGWFGRSSLEFLDFLHKNGFDLKGQCKFYYVNYDYDKNFMKNVIIKLNWLIDNVVESDEEILAYFKSAVIAWPSIPTELKSKLNILDADIIKKPQITNWRPTIDDRN